MGLLELVVLGLIVWAVWALWRSGHRVAAVVLPLVLLVGGLSMFWSFGPSQPAVEPGPRLVSSDAAEERVAIELRDGTTVEGRLLDFGERRYRVRLGDGEVRDIPETKVREVRFTRTPAPPPASRPGVEGRPVRDAKRVIEGEPRFVLTNVPDGFEATTVARRVRVELSGPRTAVDAVREPPETVRIDIARLFAPVRDGRFDRSQGWPGSGDDGVVSYGNARYESDLRARIEVEVALALPDRVKAEPRRVQAEIRMAPAPPSPAALARARGAAIEKLLRLLDSTDPETVALACAALRDVGEDPGVDPARFLPPAADPADERQAARARAILAVAPLASPELRAHLAAIDERLLARADDWRGLAVAAALARLGDGSKLDRIAESLAADGSDQPGRFAVDAARAAADPGLEEALRKTLQSRDTWRSAEAAILIGDLGLRAAIPDLRAPYAPRGDRFGVFPPDSDARERAVAYALARFGDVDARGRLLERARFSGASAALCARLGPDAPVPAEVLWRGLGASDSSFGPEGSPAATAQAKRLSARRRIETARDLVGRLVRDGALVLSFEDDLTRATGGTRRGAAFALAGAGRRTDPVMRALGAAVEETAFEPTLIVEHVEALRLLASPPAAVVAEAEAEAERAAPGAGTIDAARARAEALAHLRARLEAPDLRTQAAAWMLLSKLGEKPSVEPLREAIAAIPEPAPEREGEPVESWQSTQVWAPVGVLVQAGDPGLAPLFDWMAATGDPMSARRLAGAAGLARLGEERGERAIREAYESAARAGDDPAAHLALFAAAVAQTRSFAPELAEPGLGLGPGIAYQAAIALGEMGAADAKPALERAATQAEDRPVQVAARYALARFGDEKPLTGLISTARAREARDVALAAEAIHFLGRLKGNARAQDALVDLLGDPAPYVRMAAATALAENPSRSAGVFVADRLKRLGPTSAGDESSGAARERTLLVRALGACGVDARGVAPWVDDRAPSIRAAAAVALARVAPQDERALPALFAAFLATRASPTDWAGTADTTQDPAYWIVKLTGELAPDKVVDRLVPKLRVRLPDGPPEEHRRRALESTRVVLEARLAALLEPGTVVVDDRAIELRVLLRPALAGEDLASVARVLGEPGSLELRLMGAPGDSPVLTGEHVKEARVTPDEFFAPAVQVTFTAEGAARVAAFSEKNIGKQVVFSIGRRFLTAPVIRGRMGEIAVITGDFTATQARELAAIIGSGDGLPLTPVRVEPLEF